MNSMGRRQRGDTIVEVILAITVLSVILTITYTLSTRGYRTLQAAKDRTQASFYAQEQVEALRSIKDANTWTAFTAAMNAQQPTFHYTLDTSTTPAFWSPVDNPRTLNGYTIAIDQQDASIPNIGFRNLDSIAGNETFTAVIKVSWTRIGTGEAESVAIVTRLRDTEFTISAAAPPSTPPPPAPYRIEGEGFSDGGTGCANGICYDNGSSGRMMYNGQTASFTYNSPTAYSKLALNLRADIYPCPDGYPVVDVLVDGATVQTITLTSPSYATYTVNYTVTPGVNHTYGIRFTNDAWGGSGLANCEDRNVHFDYMELQP